MTNFNGCIYKWDYKHNVMFTEMQNKKKEKNKFEGEVKQEEDKDDDKSEDDGPNVMTSWNGNAYIQSWNQNTGNVGGIWTFGGDGTTIFPTLSVQRGDNPSGTITGQTLLFGDSTQEAIISTPDGTSGINSSQRLVINPGEGFAGGEGGDIYLWAGRGGPTNGSGGDIKIRGGQGMADGTGVCAVF